MFSPQRKSKTADVDISIHHLKITALEKKKWCKKTGSGYEDFHDGTRRTE